MRRGIVIFLLTTAAVVFLCACGSQPSAPQYISDFSYKPVFNITVWDNLQFKPVQGASVEYCCAEAGSPPCPDSGLVSAGVTDSNGNIKLSASAVRGIKYSWRFRSSESSVYYQAETTVDTAAGQNINVTLYATIKVQ